MTARLVIAGTASGVGKTTVTIALMAALRARGLIVQPFKVGPDYIDPSYHSAVAGRPARNLDSYFLPRERLLECLNRAVAGAEIAVIEGVMGLYDGRTSERDEGSTAEVARWLDAPVVLVVDVSAMARSAAALVRGFRDFDPTLRWAGIVLNRVGSPRHAEMVRAAIEHETGLPVLGSLPRQPEFTLPERHLGLVLASEQPLSPAWATFGEHHLDLPRILQIATAAPPLPSPEPHLFPPRPVPPRAAIAIAQDAAFAFYYQDTLDLLQAHGAELVPFSPLADPALPPDASAIYLGGGYPELHAEHLAANDTLRQAIRAAHAAGLPIYAECGGLMYLAEALEDSNGVRHPMVGLVPGVSRLQARPVLAYVEVTAVRPLLFAQPGEVLRGHEFHYSTLPPPLPDQAAYRVLRPAPRWEGFARPALLASYVHLHFGVNPALAPRLVEAAAQAHQHRTRR